MKKKFSPISGLQIWVEYTESKTNLSTRYFISEQEIQAMGYKQVLLKLTEVVKTILNRVSSLKGEKE
jgi:hypothetical protein